MYVNDRVRRLEDVCQVKQNLLRIYSTQLWDEWNKLDKLVSDKFMGFNGP